MRLVSGIVPIAVGIFTAFLGVALLARVVGPEVFGNYIFILSCATAAALLAKSGQEWILLKVIPVYLQKGAWPQIRFVVERGFGNVARIAGVSAAILVMLGFAAGQLLTLSAAAAAFALVIVLAIAEMRRAWALAHRALWLSDVPENVVKSIVLVAVASALISLDWKANSTELLWLNAVTTTLTSLAATLIFVRSNAPELLRVVPESVDVRDHNSVARWMLLSTSANILLNVADVIAVGLFFDAVTTGIYAVASRIAALASGPNMIMSRIAVPHLSVAAASADHGEVQRISREYVAITTSASLTIFITVQVFAQPGIHLLFGPSYSEAETAATILIFGHVAIGVIGPAGLFMAVADEHINSAITSALAAAIGLVLLTVLTPMFGPTGAACAATTALILKSMASSILVWMKFGIDTTVLSFWRSR